MGPHSFAMSCSRPSGGDCLDRILGAAATPAPHDLERAAQWRGKGVPVPGHTASTVTEPAVTIRSSAPTSWMATRTVDRPSRVPSTGQQAVAAGDVVLHYLRPAKVGPIEARCTVLGTRDGRSTVRVAIHDVGADDRMVTAGSVTVLAV